MKDFKGTQGKWTVGKTKHSKKEFKGGCIYLEADSHSEMIEVNFSPSGLEKAKHNANLTAAAPELLEELIEMHNNSNAKTLLEREWLYRVGKLINKALGQ